MNTIKKNIHIILSILMLCLYTVLIVIFSYSHKPKLWSADQLAEQNLYLHFKNIWVETDKTLNISSDFLEKTDEILDKSTQEINFNFSLRYDIYEIESNNIVKHGVWSNVSEENINTPIKYKKRFPLSEKHQLEFSIFQIEPKTTTPTYNIIIRYSLILGFFMLIILLLLYYWQKNRSKNQLKTDYMYGITHEMKSILTTILLAGEFLKNNKGAKNEDEYINIITNESKEILKMVQQILNMAVLEKKELYINYELINIQTLIEDIIQSYSVKINNYQGHIEFSNEVSGMKFWADKMLLKLAISNLIDNSIKYTAFHPIIHITAKEECDYFLIKIKDNGIGIPKSQLNNIFKPAVRLKNAVSKKPSGVGMGLYFVKQIIKIHKGKIKVNSELNKGSEFCVYIPKYE